MCVICVSFLQHFAIDPTIAWATRFQLTAHRTAVPGIYALLLKFLLKCVRAVPNNACIRDDDTAGGYDDDDVAANDV